LPQGVKKEGLFLLGGKGVTGRRGQKGLDTQSSRLGRVGREKVVATCDRQERTRCFAVDVGLGRKEERFRKKVGKGRLQINRRCLSQGEGSTHGPGSGAASRRDIANERLGKKTFGEVEEKVQAGRLTDDVS